MIRVLLVDDQTLVRQGIRSLLDLTPDLRVVAEAADGDEALALIRGIEADVILLDVRMPRTSGIDVLRALHGAGRLPATILLTTFEDDAVVLEALRLGAKGFLLKDVSLEQLAAAVRVVASGGSMVLPFLTERLRDGGRWVRSDFECLERPDVLTPRESEVLRLVAAGYSNREIGKALDTAEGTIKNHVSSILSKLGVRDRTRAVLRALALGWVQGP